jgi:hypothetical protein
VQTSLEKGFVRVNVADTSHHSLIEQDRLERALGGRQPLLPVAGIEAERLGSQAHLFKKNRQGFRPGEKSGAAKTPDVPEAKLSGILQLHDQVRMPEHLLVGRHHGQLARHAQVDDQLRSPL